MIINNSTMPVWQELALQDLGIKRVVIPGLFAQNFRSDSTSPVETSGYLTGVYVDNTFYVISHQRLCIGKAIPWRGPVTRSVGVHPERHHAWVFYEEVTRRFSEAVKSVSTILWHTHPKLNAGLVRLMCPSGADDYIKLIEEEILYGCYDHLGENGKKPSLDFVLNEKLSRILSPDDIRITPGCAHLLITDTPLSGGSTSHLNPFRIKREESGQYSVESMPVELLSKQSRQVRKWYRSVQVKYKDAFEKSGERHEAIVSGLPYIQQMKPGTIPLDVFFING